MITCNFYCWAPTLGGCTPSLPSIFHRQVCHGYSLDYWCVLTILVADIHNQFCGQLLPCALSSFVMLELLRSVGNNTEFELCLHYMYSYLVCRALRALVNRLCSSWLFAAHGLGLRFEEKIQHKCSTTCTFICIHCHVEAKNLQELSSCLYWLESH